MERIIPILSDNNKHKISLAKPLIRHEKDQKNLWGRTDEELSEKLNNGLKLRLKTDNLSDSEKEEFDRTLKCSHEFYSWPDELFLSQSGNIVCPYVCSKCGGKTLP